MASAADRYQQVWPICRRQNRTLLSLSELLLYKSAYRAVVIYANTVDERKFSTVLRSWKGRVKVVRRRRTTQTPTSSLMNYGADATDRSLTTRLRHRAGVSRRYSTACRRSVVSPSSSRRRAESVEVDHRMTKTSPSITRCRLLHCWLHCC